MDVEKELRHAMDVVQGNCILSGDWDGSQEDELRIVRDCVEKQIPLQPNKLIGCDIFECYICNHPVKRYHNYCQSCGQRIEWNKDKWVE